MEYSVFSSNPEMVANTAMMVIVLVSLIFALIGSIIKFILWCKIFSKAGYSKAFSMIILAPFGTLIMMCILAFGQWPALKD